MGDQAVLDEVAAEIKAVNAKLEEVEAEIKQARAEHAEEVAALRKEKERLGTKEEQLRTKELLLLQRQPGTLLRLEALVGLLATDSVPNITVPAQRSLAQGGERKAGGGRG